jgi:integrase
MSPRPTAGRNSDYGQLGLVASTYHIRHYPIHTEQSYLRWIQFHNALTRSGDIRTLQELLGHKELDTTDDLYARHSKRRPRHELTASVSETRVLSARTTCSAGHSLRA